MDTVRLFLLFPHDLHMRHSCVRAAAARLISRHHASCSHRTSRKQSPIQGTTMAPQDHPSNAEMPSNEIQSLFIVRHGDRWDYAHPEWRANAQRPGDPPLSTLGHQQARETGAFLDTLFAEEGISAENITWLSSPFLADPSDFRRHD